MDTYHWDVLVTYHWDVVGCFIWDLFETSWGRLGEVLMRRRCYVLLWRRHDVPIRRRGDVPLRRLGDVPTRRRWVFHVGRTCDVDGTYRETSLRRRHDVLLPDGKFIVKTLLPLYFLVNFHANIFFIFIPIYLKQRYIIIPNLVIREFSAVNWFDETWKGQLLFTISKGFFRITKLIKQWYTPRFSIIYV